MAARVTHECAVFGQLTWNQLEAMKADGVVEVPFGAEKTLRVTQEEYDAKPDLAAAGGSPSAFLVLHGSRDSAVPSSEADALNAMLHEGGSRSHELRVIPGMGSGARRSHARRRRPHL